MITKGTSVPFQVGLLSVKADVLGISQDKRQYILLLAYYRWDSGGNWTEKRRIYYRDRYFIEGLYQDAGGII